MNDNDIKTRWGHKSHQKKTIIKKLNITNTISFAHTDSYEALYLTNIGN
jgi:hypothetical protein